MSLCVRAQVEMTDLVRNRCSQHLVRADRQMLRHLFDHRVKYVDALDSASAGNSGLSVPDLVRAGVARDLAQDAQPEFVGMSQCLARVNVRSAIHPIDVDFNEGEPGLNIPFHLQNHLDRQVRLVQNPDGHGKAFRRDRSRHERHQQACTSCKTHFARLPRRSSVARASVQFTAEYIDA